MNETFKEYLLQLDNCSFTSLLTNYLGPKVLNLKRNEAINQLINFLERADIQENLSNLLTKEDVVLLSIVKKLTKVNFVNLQSFYFANGPYWLEDKLVNLSERLWLLYNNHNGSYFINPLFNKLIVSLNLNDNLYLASEDEVAAAKPFWLNDGLLLAYLTKTADSQFNLPNYQQNFLKQVTYHLSLSIGDTLNIAALKQLEALNSIQRLAYLLAAYFKSDVANFFANLIEGYQGKVIEVNLVGRLLFLSCGEEFKVDESFLKKLIDCGLVSYYQDSNTEFVVAACFEVTEKSLIMQSDFTAYVTGNTGFKTAFAASFNLQSYDTLASYTLSSESFSKALAAGISAAELWQTLQVMASQPINANILSQLEHWQSYYSRAIIYKGYMLQLSAEKEQLADSYQLFNDFNLIKVAAGLYFLPQEPAASFYAVLNQIGLNPLVKESKPAGSPLTGQPKWLKIVLPPAVKVDMPQGKLYQGKPATWQRRAERGLLLAAEQLEYTPDKEEEVQGLDYQGKARLISRAINERAGLEVTLRQQDTLIKLKLKPINLKKEGEAKLLLAVNTENWQKITLPVNVLAKVKILRPLLAVNQGYKL